MNSEIKPVYAKKRVIVPVLTAFLFLLIGIYMAVYSIYFQSTDDAFIEGRMIAIAPKVSGHVLNLYVDDNKEVKKGDLLLEIDPLDYEVALKQKEAELEMAKAFYSVADKKIKQSESEFRKTNEDVYSSVSKLDFAQKDFDRYSKMYEKGIASKQEYDKSKNELIVAKANHRADVQNKNSKQSIVQSSKANKTAQAAEIKKLKAEVEKAKLDLSYTKIYAPKDGKITHRSIEEGDYIQVAQSLFAIVPDEVWIVANFKETQIANMKEGQEVTIKIDTYGQKKFRGKVDSIQRSTGAKASLFPPENAVGSYVKVVQRVPVKIIFTEDIKGYNIVPGMSVIPNVKVR